MQELKKGISYNIKSGETPNLDADVSVGMQISLEVVAVIKGKHEGNFLIDVIEVLRMP